MAAVDTCERWDETIDLVAVVGFIDSSPRLECRPMIDAQTIERAAQVDGMRAEDFEEVPVGGKDDIQKGKSAGGKTVEAGTSGRASIPCTEGTKSRCVWASLLPV